ncbi:helix-turn-helix transcriptional regulator [Fredinandcohnia sp. 179-A 10B2 NHS]|uniref:helix-turn-helix transcriptional regulator n=1 Tax=Fredinandcohnia sp. 179-A 10B2 NHS TaxID=3235176 RepID=UPI0039A3B464
MPNNIKQLREQANITQEELAKRIGVSRIHMNKMENGKKPITMVKALKLAEIFNVTLNDIFLSSSGQNNPKGE